MATRSTFVAVLVLSLAWTARAHAQSPSAHDTAVAEFGAGRALFAAGDCAGAAPHFIASLAAEQSVGARFNLAECAEREGRAAEAWNHFKAVARLATGRGESERATLARVAAAKLESRVAVVRIVLPPGEGATLTVDGVVVDATDHWLLASGYALTPGVSHTLAAAAPGQPRWERRDVRGEAGAELPPLTVAFTAKAEEQPRLETTRPFRAAALGIGGLGIVALATGGVFAVLASSAKSDAKSACASRAGFSYPDACDPLRRGEVTSANGAAKTDAAVATVAIIGGALLVAAAAALLSVSRSRPSSPLATTLRLVAGERPGALLSGSF